MKKILLAIAIGVGMLSSFRGQSQTATFTVPQDTVHATVTGAAVIHDDITNTFASGGLSLKWHVVASNFPTDWANSVALGICDINLCRNNMGDTMIWNAATNYGPFFTASYPYNAAGTFDLSLDLSSASTGSHYITVAINDNANAYSKNVTFVINRIISAVPSLSNVESNIALYPNPATDEINVVYDANSDIKNIAVYNIIGKLMSVYRVTGNSANLNLENTPSGIYFVRLVNSNGQVVATRKFTKQ